MTRVSFNVSIIDDNVLENDENFTLTINPSEDYDVINNSSKSTTVTIVDDDCKWSNRGVDNLK